VERSWKYQAFLAQRVVMTANTTLSIPNALKRDRPDDYYKNTATIEWPLGPHGEPFPIVGEVVSAMVFKEASNTSDAVDFVRFLVAEGWLAHYLDFSAERLLPPMTKLLEQPFWLDTSDPHRMASVMQISSRSLAHGYAYAEISGNWRHQLVNGEFVWAKAVHRVVTDNISPEQAEQESGKQVQLILSPQEELLSKIQAALQAGKPPDFAFGLDASSYISQWAFDDRLVDLSAAVGTFTNMFDAEVLNSATLLNGRSGQRALYAVPMGQATHLVHVWKSLLEQAGFTLDDVPKDWDSFWSFWCDQVQPAVRQTTGRQDIWGVGLIMSAEAFDGVDAFFQFVVAFHADYVTSDGQRIIDEPGIRANLIKAIDAYTAILPQRLQPARFSNLDQY
jgi:ABC-type glycerol-3-phosphate transport system substrate-binding protein